MNVEFEENNFSSRNFGSEPTPKLAAWLINKGLAKDVSGANRLQVAVAVVFLAISAYFFFF